MQYQNKWVFYFFITLSRPGISSSSGLPLFPPFVGADGGILLAIFTTFSCRLGYPTEY